MSGKIPVRLRPKFVAHMKAMDNDDLPDGAWFANLEAAAQQFIDTYRLKWVDCNDAAHQYLKLSEEGKQS